MEKSIPDQLRELAEKIEKESKEKEGGRLRAKNGRKYWLIDIVGKLGWNYDVRDVTDNFHYNTGNYYRTEEGALKAADHEAKWLTSLMKIKDYIAENFGVFEPDWEKADQAKLQLYFRHAHGHGLQYDLQHIVQEQSPFGYLRSAEHAKQLIAALPKELEFVIRNPFKL